MYTTFALPSVAGSATTGGSTPTKRACDTCRKLKIKCRQKSREPSRASSDSETCEQCRSGGFRCTYNNKPRKPGRRGKGLAQYSLNRDQDRSAPLDGEGLPHGSGPGSIASRGLSPADATGQAHPIFLVSGNDTFARAVSSTPDAAPTLPLNDSLRTHDYDSDLNRRTPSTIDHGLDPGGQDHQHSDVYELEQEAWQPSARHESASYGTRPGDVHSRNWPDEHDIRAGIQQFFEKSWVVFPVLSYDSLCRRLSLETSWDSDAPLRTLLLSILVANLSCEFRIASQNGPSLLAAVRDVERSRLDYDFAEPPSLDDVVVSLFLFVAYNVLEKHTRAYLYLDEAFSLLGAAGATSDVERRRKRLIEQVLFNTETASVAIYTLLGRQRRSQRPKELLRSIPTSSSQDGQITEYDRLALQLLTRLTEIHAADDTAALEDDLSGSQDLRALWSVSLQQRQYWRIQAADVSVSHQWRLSTKLANKLKSRALTQKTATAKAEILGVAAMAWICSLKDGELRIVGLGKIFGILQAIRYIAGNNGCDDVTNGLVGALMREDHEKNFAAGVANIVMPLVPAPLCATTGLYTASQIMNIPITHANTLFNIDEHGPLHNEGSSVHSLGTEPEYGGSQILALTNYEDDDTIDDIDWFGNVVDEDHGPFEELL